MNKFVYTYITKLAAPPVKPSMIKKLLGAFSDGGMMDQGGVAGNAIRWGTPAAVAGGTGYAAHQQGVDPVMSAALGAGAGLALSPQGVRRIARIAFSPNTPAGHKFLLDKEKFTGIPGSPDSTAAAIAKSLGVKASVPIAAAIGMVAKSVYDSTGQVKESVQDFKDATGAAKQTMGNIAKITDDSSGIGKAIAGTVDEAKDNFGRAGRNVAAGTSILANTTGQVDDAVRIGLGRVGLGAPPPDPNLIGPPAPVEPAPKLDLMNTGPVAKGIEETAKSLKALTTSLERISDRAGNAIKRYAEPVGYGVAALGGGVVLAKLVEAIRSNRQTGQGKKKKSVAK